MEHAHNQSNLSIRYHKDWCLAGSFTHFTKPLANNLKDKGSSHHFFAVDKQMYQFFQAKCAASLHQAVTSTDASVQAAQNWMVRNKLKCNSERLRYPSFPQRKPLWHLFPSRLVTQRFRVRRLSGTWVYTRTHISPWRNTSNTCAEVPVFI